MQLKYFIRLAILAQSLIITQAFGLKISAHESLIQYNTLANTHPFHQPMLSVWRVGVDTLQSSVKSDKELVLLLAKVGTRKILRVSFNGHEGTAGSLKIYNAHNEIIREASFELIKSPFYASVDVTEIGAGKYTVVLSTLTAKHTAAITIQ